MNEVKSQKAVVRVGRWGKCPEPLLEIDDKLYRVARVGHVYEKVDFFPTPGTKPEDMVNGKVPRWTCTKGVYKFSKNSNQLYTHALTDRWFVPIEKYARKSSGAVYFVPSGTCPPSHAGVTLNEVETFLKENCKLV